METINEHIKRYSDWIVKCFATENLHLDYSIDSLKCLDKFLADNVTNGIPNINGILYKNHKKILYGIGVYLGETLKMSLPDSQWLTKKENGVDQLTGEFILPNGTQVFPLGRVIRRFENGEEDSIYPYGLILVNEVPKDEYWNDANSKKL